MNRQERAARILHDDVGPLLSAAGLQLQLLKMDFPETAEGVRGITELLDKAIDSVRAVSQELLGN